jgi:poly(3-hydroxybutyrate) depolymerase
MFHIITKTPSSLVVMLHGFTQDADKFANRIFAAGLSDGANMSTIIGNFLRK